MKESLLRGPCIFDLNIGSPVFDGHLFIRKSVFFFRMPNTLRFDRG
jgi:hypothetical protein